jgi:hypothetical protein
MPRRAPIVGRIESGLPPTADIVQHGLYVEFGPSADLARQSNSLPHEDKTPLLRVAQWVACAPCGLERIDFKYNTQRLRWAIDGSIQERSRE